MTKTRVNTEAMESETSHEVFDETFKPLTPEEAQQWRKQNPPVSPWRVIWMQVAAALVVVLLAWLVGGKSVALSTGYGAGAVIFPAAVLARAMHRQMLLRNAGVAFLSFVIWESVKVVLTVALLLLAPKVVPALNWLALVAGFVAMMKVYWLAAWLQSKSRIPA